MLNNYSHRSNNKKGNADMKRVLSATGIVLTGFALLWHFLLARHWTQRIPPGWKWKTTVIGSQAVPDEKTGKMPDQDMTVIYSRETRIIDENKRPSSVVIGDTYITKDAMTNQKTYEYIIRYPLNPRTGEHLTSEFKGDYAVFPRNLEKKGYRYRASYIVNGIPLTWQKEDSLEGLKVWLFSYKGPIEYTVTYAGTAGYPGVKVSAGQEIKCKDDQFMFKAWVEPVTGEIARLEESCYSGDYIFDKATGREIAAIMRWGGETAGDDDMLRIELIRRELTRLLWVSRYIPLLLFGSGLVCLGIGMIPGRS